MRAAGTSDRRPEGDAAGSTENAVLETDRDKFDEWATATGPKIRNLCFSYLSGLKEEGAEDPQDVAQIVLAKCWDQISKEPTEGWRLVRKPAWIRVLTKNACTDLWRKIVLKSELKLDFDLTSERYDADDAPSEDRSRETPIRNFLRKGGELASATFDPFLTPETELLNREFTSVLQEEVAKLSPNQSKVLALSHFGELPQKEIAAIIGRSEGTVNSELTRGLKNLHKGLARHPREVEAHFRRLDRSSHSRGIFRPPPNSPGESDPLNIPSSELFPASRWFRYLRLFPSLGATEPTLDCAFDCASCENLRERSRLAETRVSGEEGVAPALPAGIISPVWTHVAIPDDPDEIALMEKIHAGLKLVRKWTSRSHYPTEGQIKKEREKRALNLQPSLDRISAEILNAQAPAACTFDERWEWYQWTRALEEKEKELKQQQERIRATSVRQIRRAWWVEKELRDVAYFLNTDNVPPHFGNRWHSTGVGLFMQRNTAMAKRLGILKAGADTSKLRWIEKPFG